MILRMQEPTHPALIESLISDYNCAGDQFWIVEVRAVLAEIQRLSEGGDQDSCREFVRKRVIYARDMRKVSRLIFANRRFLGRFQHAFSVLKWRRSILHTKRIEGADAKSERRERYGFLNCYLIFANHASSQYQKEPVGAWVLRR